MRRAGNILICVFAGIAGGWIGYWIGYAAGWSTNAQWPREVGGGTGAILLSIGTSVLFVALAAIAVFYVPQRGLSRMQESGVTARATVIDISETGASRWTREGTRRQIRCELEVCPPDGAPYLARAVQFVGVATEEVLRPGTTVAVRVDPREPERVAIDEPLSRVA